MPNSMIYLKNFQSNRFEKNYKKVIFCHYPILEVKMAIGEAEDISISYYGNQFFFIPIFIENYQ